jgi:basic amino acid/polyamine antiporter, APA family
LWTALKLLLIVGFLSAGLLFGSPQPISFAPSASDINFMTSVPFATSLVFVMYSYSGWNAATYIIGEIKEPNRSLPRALFLGTLIVIGLYVGLNAVFLTVTPIQELAGQLDVAMIAGTYLFGEVGGRIVGMLICLGLVSSISAMMWIGPRVTMTMGEDMPLLRAFSRRSDKGVPANAIIFQLVISTLLLATQSYAAVLEFVQFSLTFCSFFTVLGVIKMRITHPNMPRPYRAWGYPVTPIVFLTVMLWMMYYLVLNQPVQSLAGFAVMLSGVAIYALSNFLSKSMSADTPAATV